MLFDCEERWSEQSRVLIRNDEEMEGEGTLGMYESRVSFGFLVGAISADQASLFPKSTEYVHSTFIKGSSTPKLYGDS
jgi:hypothetical protein